MQKSKFKIMVFAALTNYFLYKLPRSLPAMLRNARRAGDTLIFHFAFLIFNFPYYQLDFLTPGISPWLASSRKHILHNPKSLMKPCLRPQRQQLRTARVENFGFFSALASVDVLAILRGTRIQRIYALNLTDFRWIRVYIRSISVYLP